MSLCTKTTRLTQYSTKPLIELATELQKNGVNIPTTNPNCDAGILLTCHFQHLLSARAS